ncbi:DHH family phosphoesterase [Vagococcus xieshaowenii]|uniref:Bifunctional oligoribonuclease/PAP phosphatase NrnA n=1 Tax=Vagococcus xieshaowenii TaxID=2562451 RepID=A0AAJ5EDY6_9ENTE|nr:bifunctional oligoribonuclease/PAP phosphatase NrnA [Vagococcus xieshaowenii]QCA27923.1 bifunctional oligoribonuclease/PAP phosphatase NrnA [Vagococcus xieshaowenii]TFZ39399.1 bifunctional oligoribonuclease/PAP phosphatase NrnA [Vagococcus xieshaowenii]
MMIQQEILKAIKQYETIIIHRHERPDPDALGSQGGLAEIILASFPEKKVYLVGEDVANLLYLNKMDEVEDEVYQGALVIVTDTANSPRIDDKRYALGDKLVKIDHHPNDEPYGDLVWVNTGASSCSEIIYDFYAQFEDELTLTDEGARLLYAGIVGDTGRFMYPASTAHTLEVAAKLRQYDFDAIEIHRQMDEMDEKVGKLMGYVLANIDSDGKGTAKVVIPYSILEEYGIDDSETSGLIPVAGKISTIQVWALFVQQPSGVYRVRMRSKGPVINEIAKRHRGGGHPLASGAFAADQAEIDQIFAEMQAVLK